MGLTTSNLRNVLRAMVVASLFAAPLRATTSEVASFDAITPERAAAAPVLEPSTLLLVGLGLVGIAVFRTRYRHQKD